MTEKLIIDQGVVLLFIVTLLLTAGLIVEHSRLAIIPLLITIISGGYVIYKLNERNKC